MARPNPASSHHRSDSYFQAGGSVAAMHQALEARFLAGQPPLPDWADYAEPLSPTEDAIRHFSKAMGFVALIVGVVAVGAVAHLV